MQVNLLRALLLGEAGALPQDVAEAEAEKVALRSVLFGNRRHAGPSTLRPSVIDRPYLYRRARAPCTNKSR